MLWRARQAASKIFLTILSLVPLTYLPLVIDDVFAVAVSVRAQARVARAWGCCLQILRVVRSPTAIKLTNDHEIPLEDIVNRRGESLHWASTY